MRIRGSTASVHNGLGNRLLVLLSFVIITMGLANVSSAQQCGSPWSFDEDAVGGCFGNCGAGCSSDWNWNCDDGLGWVIDQLTGPEELLYQTGSSEFCDGEYLCTSTCGLVQVPGHFTYWGTFSIGCANHDDACRNGDWSTCYTPSPEFLAHMCDGQDSEPWPYTGYMRAIVALDTQCEYAYPRCPEVYGQSTQGKPGGSEMKAKKGGFEK